MTVESIRAQLSEVINNMEGTLDGEMILSAVVVVRTKTGIHTVTTHEEAFYGLIGMLECAKVDLIEEALER